MGFLPAVPRAMANSEPSIYVSLLALLFSFHFYHGIYTIGSCACLVLHLQSKTQMSKEQHALTIFRITSKQVTNKEV